MNVLRISRWCTLTALVALGTAIGLSQQVAAQQPPAPAENGIEVLTRGPVHEAFAETITFDPEAGIVAPQAPPAAIEELPPQQRPAGANLTWVPGYWAWDDERNDFLWVSGIWRALPPGRQWVPGYWGQSQQGSQWTSGYWADAAAREIAYLPEPPATVEAGPNVAAASEDDIWLPGCWIWQQNRYAWRAGYWAKGNQNWDWVPDHYVWTPSGYVFVDGYYDYSVPRRGVVFAPVYFNRGLRSQRGFSYSPSTVINPGVFVSHLFLRPRYGHYYFGDYYDTNYSDAGFSPWFSFHTSRRGYDPIYANRRWHHRHDRDWEHRAEANFRNYRDNEDDRPPRTWAAQRERDGRGDKSNRKNNAVAASLDELAQNKNAQFQFQPVDQEERQQFGQRGKEYRKFQEQRQQLEADAPSTTAVDPAATTGPARRRLPTSPFVAMPVEQLDKNNAPPLRHEVLKPDFEVQPQPRRHRGRADSRQDERQESAVEPQQQVPQTRRNVGSQDERQEQGPDRGKTRDASQDRRGHRRSEARDAPNERSQDELRDQDNDKPKKKDKD